jgi:hypothetical protein
MKYQNNISNKFAKILSNNTKNERIDFKTNNDLIKHINNRTKNFTKYSLSFENAGIYKLKCKCNKLYIGKTYRYFKIRCREHIFEI